VNTAHKRTSGVNQMLLRREQPLTTMFTDAMSGNEDLVSLRNAVPIVLVRLTKSLLVKLLQKEFIVYQLAIDGGFRGPINFADSAQCIAHSETHSHRFGDNDLHNLTDRLRLSLCIAK
jgi:hypothetical protein